MLGSIAHRYARRFAGVSWSGKSDACDASTANGNGTVRHAAQLRAG